MWRSNQRPRYGTSMPLSRGRPPHQTASGYASAFSRRDAPEVCVIFTLLENRGRRESRAPIAPAVVRTKSARVDHRFNRDHPGFPRAMVYGLLRALPGERAFLPPSPCGYRCISTRSGGHISTRLDASFAAPGPHDFAVRARLAKALAGPRAIRPVSSKTVGSAVRPHAG